MGEVSVCSLLLDMLECITNLFTSRAGDLKVINSIFNKQELAFPL